MKPKTMILMGLAITCGLGASYMTSRLLAERQAPDAPETVEILVASRTINVHERITKPEEMFEKKAVSKDSEPPDAIHDFEALKGKVVKQGRNKGDHITASNLYDKYAGLEIPEGYHAAGVRVNVETTASGLASLPGSHVNLILTMRGNDPRQLQTIVLLERVLVLAADIRVTPEGEIAAPAQVVTFALKEEDVLKVVGAKEMGIISLVKRTDKDNNVSKVRVMTGAQIIDGNKKVEVEVTPPPVVVEKPKEQPKPVEPVVKRGYYDIVQGSDSGPREVTRVFYQETEDGGILIEREVLIESSRSPVAPNFQYPKSGARDF
jgi:Flp pilus assembly protein CpaB